MSSRWIKFLLRGMALFLACLFLLPTPPASATQASDDEQTLWTLEHDYFRYVESNDLAGYSSLWHERFLGWPSVSPTPVHKDHITDWITAQTSKGLAFKLLNFQPAAIQVTGRIGVTSYWVTYKFVDKDGYGQQSRTRITHTWLAEGKNWRIISGMSMPETGQTPSRPEVSEKLSSPAAENVILQVHGAGSQIYACQPGADQKLAWIFKAPEAELFDVNNKSVGQHYAGPTWKLHDGSEVVGKVAARQDAPVASDIPWLLLTAVSHTGNGILTAVTSIQRIHTQGGQPPPSGCDASHVGSETKSAYSADYYFYALEK